MLQGGGWVGQGPDHLVFPLVPSTLEPSSSWDPVAHQGYSPPHLLSLVGLGDTGALEPGL